MNEEKKINQRIRELREHLGMSRRDFEVATGIDRKVIENIELLKQKVYFWQIEQIANQWPEYSHWLAFGKALPESGQTSPEIEKIREDSTAEGAG